MDLTPGDLKILHRARRRAMAWKLGRFVLTGLLVLSSAWIILLTQKISWLNGWLETASLKELELLLEEHVQVTTIMLVLFIFQAGFLCSCLLGASTQNRTDTLLLKYYAALYPEAQDGGPTGSGLQKGRNRLF